MTGNETPNQKSSDGVNVINKRSPYGHQPYFKILTVSYKRPRKFQTLTF